jgi:hypothetical protein
MLTSDYYIDRNMETVAHVISLGFWLAGSAFIVAFLKAYWNKPPVATGSVDKAIFWSQCTYAVHTKFVRFSIQSLLHHYLHHFGQRRFSK